MITSFNPENKIQFEKYSLLFAKAYKELAEKNKLTEREIDAGRFTSLDEYFGHMEDLINIDPTYTMLPIDDQAEGIFTIDANARTITIPPQFAKCAAVQSDELCEIAIFTIDRYYDYRDLDGVGICVQWINAAGEEGVSHIQLKDLETVPGKLRFGWPLTSQITHTPGNVQFAVRFFTSTTKEVVEGTETVQKTEYQYLLNTLPNTLVVRPTLAIENPVIEEENVSGLFANFVRNSMNPSYPIPRPVFFVAPGQDLMAKDEDEPGYGAINNDPESPEYNTLTMSAQAVANDLGIINYEWRYIPAGSEISEPIEIDTDDDGIVDDTISGYTVNHWDWRENHDTERKGSQKYYTLEFDEDDTVLSYTPYLGDIPAPEGTKLYTCFTTLTINKGNEEVVGEYFVNATNTISINSTNDIYGNTTPPSPSTHCVVPAPNKVEIVENKDLPAHKFTSLNPQTNTIVAGLTVDIVNDPTLPDYTYQWYKTTTLPATINDVIKAGNEISSGTQQNYTATEPAWYAMHIKSKLNRKEEEKNTAICKVTNVPTIPELQKFYYAALPNTTSLDDIHKFINGTNESISWVECNVEEDALITNVPYGSFLVMRIDTDLDDLNPLYTERLDYQWKVQRPDGQTIDLDASQVGPNGILVDGFNLNSKVLVARHTLDQFDWNYSCEITNTIQDKSETIDSTDTYTFTFN